MDDWIRQHPTNYWALKEQARKRITAKEWAEAKAPLKTLLELIPSDTGPDNAYSSMALVCRQLDETDEEQAALAKLAAIDDTALEAYARLMDLAVSPLVPPPYRSLALASEALGQTAPAIQAYRLLLRLDPPDPAEVHYRLARLLRQTGDPAAKRQVLEALEEAPRFRDAHRLLLQMNSGTNQETGPEAIEAPKAQ
jgi:tetratricopeptide (TPR) repeat protein